MRAVPRRVRALLLAVVLSLLPAAPVQAQLPGERWIGRRGDQTSNADYRAITRTHTGRLIAVSDGGTLMISDDQGTTWRFRELAAPGAELVTLGISDIAAFDVVGSGTPRLAVAGSFLFEPVPGEDFGFFAETWIFLSDDDGESWTAHPFPHDSATFLGWEYRGVDVPHLHVSPTGHLLAFGTTTVSNLVFTWGMGGLVYRSPNGIEWEESTFAYGPLAEMADADGRLVAVGSVTAIDSADGAGWNGYVLEDAAILAPGGLPLPPATVDRLRLSDVVVHDDVYVAHATTYVPWDAAGTIDSGTVDQQFVLVSEAPFGPGRSWIAHEQPTFRGKLVSTGSGLLGFTDDLFRSGDDGATWSTLDATVDVRTGVVGRVNASTLVAVGSSHAVWRSGNDGASWTRVWNPPVGPDLRIVGTHGGLVFANGAGKIWASPSNGETWEEWSSDAITGFDMVQRGGRLVLASGVAARVWVSDDGGRNWDKRDVAPTVSRAAPSIALGSNGRLILPAGGQDVSGNGKFFVSDDGGETWQPRNAHTEWLEEPRDIVRTATGRLIVVTNTFASFNPRILKSDDNGDTWVADMQLKTLDGLDPVSNDPAQRVLEVQNLELSPTGRLLMHGRDEILTSDDDGETWVVRVNYDTPFVPPNQFWGIHDVIWSGERWVAVGSRRNAQDQRLHFTLVSDDDGTTWREVPLRLNQSTTFLDTLGRGYDGRVIVSGTNAAVYTTDGGPLDTSSTGTARVREGRTLSLPVPRPPLPGTVTLAYSGVEDTALAETDYVPLAGQLTWGPGDLDAKTVLLETVNDAVQETPERLTLQFVVEGAEVRGTTAVVVTIVDDDGGAVAAINLDGAEALITSEAGDTATLGVSLNRVPTADVVITITGLDPTEGMLSADTLTFTPANWKVQQDVVITGLDDALSDRDVAYTLQLKATSADTSYDSLAAAVASVVNVDDEPPPVGTTTTTTVAPGSTTTTTSAPGSTTTTSVPGGTTTTTSTPATTTPPLPTTTTTTLPPCDTARCILESALREGPCTGAAIPSNVVNKAQQALGALEASVTQTDKKAKKSRARARKLLKSVAKLAAKSGRGKKPKLDAACAQAIAGTAGEVGAAIAR